MGRLGEGGCDGGIWKGKEMELQFKDGAIVSVQSLSDAGGLTCMSLSRLTEQRQRYPPYFPPLELCTTRKGKALMHRSIYSHFSTAIGKEKKGGIGVWGLESIFCV